ncbi:glycerol-3-phosphate acyltransferase 2, mitochondrial isoform X1 [Rana temporaria]|uniref:glycerol-3-phosphate acyltransferase 2, mitochondrial isoform X1 n=2 Tax=Rana temporaria TaxID=8407 RepID=UPI001AAD556D|nr:glycerol-3-phosphate acyltransferase 2, mitochondrial isoform X1 [Rana temporaria]
MGSEEAPPPSSRITSKIFSLGFGQKIETVSPFHGILRPFVGQPCQSCTPKSMESFFYKRHTRLGFCNVIRITEENTRYRGWLVRRLCCVIFVWQQSVDQDIHSELTEMVCKHPSVQSTFKGEQEEHDIEKHGKSLSCAKTPGSGQKEVLRILRHIQQTLSPFLIRLVRWILLKLLQRLYLNLQLHCGQVATLLEVSVACPKTPLVYLSTHPSWLDGLLVPFVLHSQNLKVPRVAWDRTDCPRFLRYTLQRLGAVFLPPDGQSSHLSKAVLSAYTETFLEDGHSLLVFLEVLSSPSCHTLSPVACEWVWTIIEAMQSGKVTDILIVPVGISYDGRPEFYGTRGQVTSALEVCRFVVSALCPWTRRLGCARVDFAQPFSLKEYMNNYMWKHLAPVPCLRDALLPYILGVRKKMYDETAVESDASRTVFQEQALLRGFLMHSLRAALSCSSVMASHMISALLLHKHKTGVSLSRLLSELSSMTEDILLRGFDLGFSGQRWDLLRHSLYMLHSCVTIFSVPSIDVYVLCRESHDSIRDLAQRSATLLPVFLYEAVGACTLHALMVQLPSFCVTEIFLSEEELIEMMMAFCSLLNKNILLQPPCQPLYSLCQDIMDKLIHCGLLSMYEDPNATPACDTGRRSFADSLMWRASDDLSDSDCDFTEEKVKRHYKLGRSDHHADFFVFLCHLLGPVLRTYEGAALFLLEHETCGTETEADYVDQLHQYLLLKAEKDGSYECTEHSLAACAIETFKDLGVFQCSPSCHGSILHLSEPFTLKENCSRLVSFIQQFIYKG